MHRCIWSTIWGVLFCWNAAQAAILEIPNHDSVVSGVGVISGWKCEVEGDLTIVFDDGDPIPLLHGSERKDTESVCGDATNGFVAIWNWGNLSEGTHTAVVYDNGVEFDRATFDVVTYRTDFLRGAHGQCEVLDFPARGEVTTLVWDQSTQHFELDEIWMMEEGEGENDDEIDELLAAHRLEQECPLWNHYEIGSQTADYIQNCIDLGADLSPPGEHQQHPLHLVLQAQNLPAARVLLAAGADPNATHFQQHPPLYYAVSSVGSLEMVALLLDYGADPSVPSQHAGSQGDTAAHHVLQNWFYHGQEDMLTILDLLITAGADMNAIAPLARYGTTPLHIAVGGVSLSPWTYVREVLQTLLDAGAYINAQGPIASVEGHDGSYYGRTVLHNAFSGFFHHYQDRKEAVITFLLDNGADPNLQMYYERQTNDLLPDKTALLYAMSGGSSRPNPIPLSWVQLLLDAGADPNIPDAGGLTALFYVHNGVKGEQEAIERALIAAEADPTYTFTSYNGEVHTYTCLTEECRTIQGTHDGTSGGG